MLTPAKFQQHCAQLVDPNVSADQRKELIAEVRDSIEVVHTHEYRSFLNHFLPAFKVILSKLTRPQNVDNSIHKTRATILEILNRLPHNEALRSRILEVFTMSMDILKNDNEENAFHAIHIIFDLQKNYRTQLNGQVQPFLDFVRQLYQNFGETMKVLLIQRATQTPQQKQQQPTPISSSSQSFKVIKECPLLVMFVFQLYPNLIRTNIQHLLPLMVRAIHYEIPAHLIPKCPKNVFNEFIAAQVKTVSFLAYLLKQFQDLMKSEVNTIPRSIVKLMKTCPGDSVVIRKELLAATRHILTSPHRKGFFDQLDTLLDERVLVGTGRAATETLRPLAYYFLAELVHCVRLNLTIPQLEKIIFMFSTNVHDPKFSYMLQESSVRLLLNLMEGILKVNPDDPVMLGTARNLLIRILETMVEKYINLGEDVDRLLKSVEEVRSKPDPISSGERLGEVPSGDPLKTVSDFKTLLKTLTMGLKTVIWSAIKIRSSAAAPRSASNPTANVPVAKGIAPAEMTEGRPSIRSGLYERECEIVSRLIDAGKKCFRLYSRNEKANGGGEERRQNRARPSTSNSEENRKSKDSPRKGQNDLYDGALVLDPAKMVAATHQEEKDIFDQFTQIFTVLDPPSFQDVFCFRIADYFEYIVENPASMMIAQNFLANTSISKYFADLLINFLVENMGLLDVPMQQPGEKLTNEGRRAACLLKLFNILFASVTVFAANEPVLRLHLPTIVRSCLKHAAKAIDPQAYLQMLRALFKSASSAKTDQQHEVLYRDFMPLVDPLFAGLLALYNGPCNSIHKDMIIELCLMIPARPSTLFPHLEKQIQPIIWALQDGAKETPKVGLRTLEFWVEMLQPSYLDTLLRKVEPELMTALHRHLKPPGNPHGPAAARILGKLGSRFRSLKSFTIPLKFELDSEAVQQLILDWRGGIEIPMDTDKLIALSIDTLYGKRHPRGKVPLDHRVESWKFLYGCLCPYLGWTPDADVKMKETDENSAPRINWSVMGKAEAPLSANSSDAIGTLRRTRVLSKAESSLVPKILEALVGSLTKSDLRTFGMDFGDSVTKTPAFILNGLCRYFALLAVQESTSRIRSSRKGESNRAYLSESERGMVLGNNLFVEALVRVVGSENRDRASAGLSCLKQYIAAMRMYCKVTLKPPSPIERSKGEKLAADSITGEKPRPIGESQDAVPSKEAMIVEKPEVATVSSSGKPSPSHSQISNYQPSTSKLQLFAFVLAPLIERLCHCCHQRKWNAQWAGVNGLEVVFTDESTGSFISPFSPAALVTVLKALLFATRDAVDPSSGKTVEKCRSLLCNVLKAMLNPKKTKAISSNIPHAKLVRDTCNRLTMELICESPNARDTAKYCFEIVAETVGVDVSSLVKTTKDAVLRLFSQRPLRQHALATQIGYLEAINYCMELKTPLVVEELFSSPLRDNILVECMYTLEGNSSDPNADSEEGLRQRSQENKYVDLSTARELITLKRRVLQVLCNISIHCAPQLQENNNERLFRGLITCLFRSLQSKDDEILQSAKKGLKQAITKHPKPKELLQLNLRPILVYLGDYKKLTIPYLQGLSRVLTLFSHWFNVSLGEKLLEHLHRWTNPEKLIPVKKIRGADSRIAAAILELFHLLPAVASRFLEQIFEMVIRLESVIGLASPGAAHHGLKSDGSASTSPYRAPLLKYCNRHCETAGKFLLAKLDDDRIRQIFFVMMRSDDSEPLRKDLTKNTKRLLSASLFSGEGPPGRGKELHILTLIDILSSKNPEWLGSDQEIISKLLTYWKSATEAGTLQQQNSFGLCRIREVRTMANIFIRYCKHFPKGINMLFELLPVFSVRTICDFSFVKNFLEASVTGSAPHLDRKAILLKFLSIFPASTYTQERKVHALQYIIIPMVRDHLQKRSNGLQVMNNSQQSDGNGTEKSSPRHGQTSKEELRLMGSSSPQDGFLDAPIVQVMMKELLDQSDEVLRSYDEALTTNLLQLASVMIQFMPKELNRYRKELIRFGWNNLKREDTICKHWAFVNVSRFFDAYDAPFKIILQVYVALLRACESEARELAHQALDILTPALPRRITHNPADSKHPIWIRYTKKILLEESHNVPNQLHIYQLFLRNSKLFYASRGQFIPVMMNSLSRVGLSNSVANENRRLIVDMVDLILKWESTRRESISSNMEDKMSGVKSKKRPREEASSGNGTRTGGNMSASATREPPAKTLKTNEGQSIPVSEAVVKQEPEEVPSGEVLRKTMSDASSEKKDTGDSATEPPKMKDGQSTGVTGSASQATISVSRDIDEYKPTSNMVDILVNLLAQIPFRALARREGPILSARCFALLKKALQLWPEATVKLAFVEKQILETSKKGNARSLSGSISKSTAGGDSANEAKKSETQKNDKLEQARMKKEMVRHSTISVSLVLTTTLVKIRGPEFLHANLGAVRSLVMPALTEGVQGAAFRLASLIKEILRICPFPDQISTTPKSGVNAGKDQSGKATGSSGSAPMSVEPSSQQKKNPQVPSTTPIGLDDASKKSIWNLGLSKDLNVAIERCLRSTSTTHWYSGMIALKALSSGARREFIKYQDILKNILHRLTKDNLSAGSAVNTSSQTGSGNQAAQRTRDWGSAHSTSVGRTSINLGNDQRSDARSNDSNKVSKGGPEKSAAQSREDSQALILCLSLLGDNISTLEPAQRKSLFQFLFLLIEKCVQVEVLLEVVHIVGSWVYWKPASRDGAQVLTKEPLAQKEKVLFLSKMVIFERISGLGALELMDAYLRIILRIFGGIDIQDKRPELVPKLEKAFMLGLKTVESPLRSKFFKIFDASVDRSLAVRLNYIIAKQEWEHVATSMWIKPACELLLSAVSDTSSLKANSERARFAALQEEVAPAGSNSNISPVRSSERSDSVCDSDLEAFKNFVEATKTKPFASALKRLLLNDSEIALETWWSLFPQMWSRLGTSDRKNMEKALPLLLSKDYHQLQMAWEPNSVQAILGAITVCDPLPSLRPELVRHLGCRWNAWHMAIEYLYRREKDTRARLAAAKNLKDEKTVREMLAELEDIGDALSSIFLTLNERDCRAGQWKARGRAPQTAQALCMEQLGMYKEAQELYSDALASDFSDMIDPETKAGIAEFSFWEERWIDCARHLCQWDVLTEFSRTVVHTNLLHECLWKLPDWSALKQLLLRNPVPDGPQLKLYQAYIRIQENRLDIAENFINKGYQKAQERFCSLPETADMDTIGPVLLQFQQLVELQESSKILSELNALGKNGNSSVNVTEKVENIRVVLNTWRERVPSPHEPLTFWNEVLTWRNHIHGVVVNVLEALKEAANLKVASNGGSTNGGGLMSRVSSGNPNSAQVQAAVSIAQALPQQVLVMGVNETAWTVHRFAKACRKQGYPDVALYCLERLYPFNTMELSEYFVKTKEKTRAFMAGPPELPKHIENGLHELSRCNMDHFNERQRAQLFTLKGKLYSALGKDEEAVEAYCTALHTSADVGSAWLAWAKHCDKLQARAKLNPDSFSDFTDDFAKPSTTEMMSKGFAAELSFREAAVKCYVQAARFGSRKARLQLPRVLRLLAVDVASRSFYVSKRRSLLGSSGGGPQRAVAPGGNVVMGGLTSNTAGVNQAVAVNDIGEMLLGKGMIKTYSSLLLEIPSWMWLPWLPQVVPMLSRREADVLRPILVRVAQQYPQAVFFHLRSFMEERKSVDKPAKQQHKEAVKLSRPIAPALRVQATPALFSTIGKQVQSTRESVKKANQKCVFLRAELEKVGKKLPTVAEGTSEHQVLRARKEQLTTECITAKKEYERYIHIFHAAVQKQRQIQESLPGIAVPIKSSLNISKSSGSTDKNGSSASRRTSMETAKAPTSKPNDGQGSNSERSTPQQQKRDPKDGPTPYESADVIMTQMVKTHQIVYIEMEKIVCELAGRLKPSREENLLSVMNALLHRCQTVSKPWKDAMPTFRGALEDVSRMCFGTGSVTRDGQPSTVVVPQSIADLKEKFEAEMAPKAVADFPRDWDTFISRLSRWQRIFQQRVDLLQQQLKLENLSRQIMDIRHSDVEVFGQYCAVEPSEPANERHVKIECFSADVRILMRPFGPARGLQVLGSDGRYYDFVLETSVHSNVQSSEERTAQIYRLLNAYMFEKDAEAYRKRVNLTVPVMMGIGGRVRLVSDKRFIGCIGEGVDRYLEMDGRGKDDLIMKFRKLIGSEGGGSEKMDVVKRKKVRLEAFREICRTDISDDCVAQWIRVKMKNAANYFAFRKRFAETMGSSNAAAYITGVSSRRIHNVSFSWESGAMYHQHGRMTWNAASDIVDNDEAVPFRLTRNLEQVIGGWGVRGWLFSSMGCAAKALRNHDELLKVVIEFVLRDEVIAWMSGKIEGIRHKSEKEWMGEREFAHVEKCLANSMAGLERRLGKNGEKKQELSAWCNELIDRAMDEQNLAMMDATWQAWV